MHHISPNNLMSQAVIHNGTAVLSGQVALGAPNGSFREQTEEVFVRIDAILDRCNTSKYRLISATIWLFDLSDFAEFNSLWTAWLDGATPPARATVRADLALPGLRIEVQVSAATD